VRSNDCFGTAISVALSARGLTNLALNNYKNDFTFYAGGSEYACPSFVAEFLSPRICALRRSDSTIDVFHIQTSDTDHYFGIVLPLGFGSSVTFRSEHQTFLKRLCRELENGELYGLISCSADGDLTETNVVDRLITIESMGFPSDREIAFAASHFYNLDVQSVAGLSVSMLSRIVSHESLKLTSENSLFEVVSSAISSDANYCVLLDYVNYENLSKSSMEAFFDLISNSIEFLTISVWMRLRNRIVGNVSHSTRIKSTDSDFPFNESPFNGIISHLTQKSGGNVCDRGIVSVTASGERSYQLNEIVNFDNSNIAQTINQPNSWICYDFKEMRVKVSHYSIRSRTDSDNYFPIQWTLEGSMDGNSWINFDSRTNRNELLGRGKSATFSTSSSQFVQMIRLRQQGKDSGGTDFLTLSAFELFGTLHNLAD
jgi:hypothetical protein